MRVADLSVQNFRGVRHAQVRLAPHTVLVGPNDCGKTTIVDAIALILGRDRLVRTLTEHDFHGGNPTARDRISIVATVTDFEGDDPAQHPGWFHPDRAVPKWYDCSTGTLHATRATESLKLACQIAYCARFDRDSLEVESVRYFHDFDGGGDPFDDDVRTGVPSSVIRDVGFFLVPAARSWDRIISFGSELFRKIVAASNSQPSESVLKERDRLRKPDNPLEQDVRIEEIVLNLNHDLAEFFTDAPSLHLRVTSTDSEGVLDAVVPHYSREGGSELPARRHGSGLVSLQWLLLVLQFGRRRIESGENFMLAVEEPEIHVPVPLQRRLVQRIYALTSQAVISTHSATVAAMSDPTTVLLLRNDAGTLHSTPLLQQNLDIAAPNALRKIYQINRTETISALMHDTVLVPEGSIDKEWLQLLSRAVDLRQGWGSEHSNEFGSHVGVAPTHDAAVVETYKAMHGLHPRVSVLVDGDPAGDAYARTITSLDAAPSVVLQWPNGWAIENVVGWILEADETAAVNSLQQLLDDTITSCSDVVNRLLSEDRGNRGLKQDRIAYENIADAIIASDACVQRAARVLNAIARELSGTKTEMFADGAPNAIRTFAP